MFKNIKTTATNILVISVFFLLGVYVGFQNRPEILKVANITNKEKPAYLQTDFEPFWKAWNTIDEKSPEAENTSDQNRVYGAISGLIGSLNDPYSVFFPPDEAKSFREDIAGSFGGIGAEVGMKNKILTVITPLKDTPAYRAGLKAGDKIIKIDTTVTSDLSIEKAVKLMHGEKGTAVVLTIFRDGEDKTREIKIIRDIINIPTLDTELRSDKIFVIKLYSFSENSAELFRKAIIQFVDSKSDKLILDLRGNPGGYLDSAVNMASWFLPSGKTVLIEDYSNKKKQKLYRSEGHNIFTDKLKFVILIDGGSASASEILAGAMQDYGIAKLVGEQSYGKGSVQEMVNLTSNTLMKITVAKWLTPKGTSISLKGLTPDYKVIPTEKEIQAKEDPQMNKAVELLKNWK